MSFPTYDYASKHGYAFSWAENPEWNHPSLRSPRPCLKGAYCDYTGPCTSVHPGEEGVARWLAPACPEKGFDAPQVRLRGTPQKQASYYERRRLRMSWRDFCAFKGISLPSPPLPSHRRREVICLKPSPLPAQYVSWLDVALNPLLLTTMPPVLPDFKQDVGDRLFAFISEQWTPDLVALLKESEMLTVKTTPAKIVGMFLDGYDLEYLEHLLVDKAAFQQASLEAMELLMTRYPLAA